MGGGVWFKIPDSQKRFSFIEVDKDWGGEKDPRHFSVVVGGGYSHLVINEGLCKTGGPRDDQISYWHRCHRKQNTGKK